MSSLSTVPSFQCSLFSALSVVLYLQCLVLSTRVLPLHMRSCMHVCSSVLGDKGGGVALVFADTGCRRGALFLT